MLIIEEAKTMPEPPKLIRRKEIIKIETTICKNSLAIRYSKEGHSDKNCVESLLEWSSFVRDTMVCIVENKPAIVQVYSSDGDFEFPEITAKRMTRKHKDATYYLATSDVWSKSDVLELTSLKEFKQAALWFQLVPKIDEKKIEEEAFFNVVEKLLVGEEEQAHDQHGFQCVGNIADGEEIMWMNPNWDEAEQVLSQLKKNCDRLGFEWIVVTVEEGRSK
jgi:hypothetical protein